MKKHYGHKQPAESRENKQSVLPNVQAKMKPFIPNVSRDNRLGEARRPNAPPPNLQQNNAAHCPIQSMHRFATPTKL